MIGDLPAISSGSVYFLFRGTHSFFVLGGGEGGGFGLAMVGLADEIHLGAILEAVGIQPHSAPR